MTRTLSLALLSLTLAPVVMGCGRSNNAPISAIATMKSSQAVDKKGKVITKMQESGMADPAAAKGGAGPKK